MSKFIKVAAILIAAILICSCKEKVSVTNEGDAPVMALRLRMPNTISDENWATLLSGIRANPDCCDEVWFSTGISVPPLDVHRGHAERLVKAKEDLKALGIVTSMQVQMTIGHGDSFGNEDWSAKTWTGWTGSTGVEDKCCNCPRQEDYLEYMREMVRAYAQVKPRVMWIDDDLRYDNHKPATDNSRIGCWCEKCVSDFSARDGPGNHWTRPWLLTKASRRGGKPSASSLLTK